MSLEAYICHTPLQREVPQTASPSVSEGALHPQQNFAAQASGPALTLESLWPHTA